MASWDCTKGLSDVFFLVAGALKVRTAGEELEEASQDRRTMFPTGEVGEYRRTWEGARVHCSGEYSGEQVTGSGELQGQIERECFLPTYKHFISSLFLTCKICAPERLSRPPIDSKQD